jgi:hypothetical protein
MSAVTERQARKEAEKAWTRFDRTHRVDPATSDVTRCVFTYTANGWRISLTEHFGRWLASEPL